MSDAGEEFGVDASIGADGVALVVLRGELDFGTAPIADASIVALLDTRPERLVFDLTAVTFLDSSGIAVLVRSTQQANTVAIRNPSTIVRRVIEYTGLDETLRIES